MAAIEPFAKLFDSLDFKLSYEEQMLLEADLFTTICNELKEFFKQDYLNFFKLMKFTTEMENNMLENNFTCLIVKDILSSKEYDLKGIALYVNSTEDIINEIILGINTNPSAQLVRIIIELHKFVRKEIYINIIKKITLKFQNYSESE